MSRLPKVLGLLVGGFVMVAAASTFAATSHAAPLTALDVPVLHCPLHCDNCNEQHTLHLTHYVSAGSDAAGELHGDCFPGSCNIHGCAEMDDDDAVASAGAAARSADFVAAWNAFREADPNDLGAVVAANPQYFHVNEGRRALQVLNCAGDVFAHVPMAEAEWERLLAGIASSSTLR